MICQHNLTKKVIQVNLTVMKMKQKKNTYWNQRKPWESAAEKRQPADLPSGKTCSRTSTKAVISWNPLKAERPRSTASCEACPCLIATPSHHSQTQVVQPLMILMHHSVVQVSGSFLLCFVRWLSRVSYLLNLNVFLRRGWNLFLMTLLFFLLYKENVFY